MRDKELATIKPSEHLELLIYRIEHNLNNGMTCQHDKEEWDHGVIQELWRLQKYLRERGE